MNKYKAGLIMLTFFVALFLGGCDFVLFNSKGYTGQKISNYILITAGLMLLVIIPTILLTIWIVIKYRKGQNSQYDPEWEHSSKIEFLAWGVPVVIIAVLATITYFTSHSLDPRKSIASDKEPMTIQVVALEWKWLFIYPDQGIATINDIGIPTNRPIEFLITSNDTMNSFFIPSLGGQIYAMAGMENRLNLMANQEGVYEGISANYSGFGFSGMRFKVHSLSDKGFDDWVKKVKTSTKKLDATTYEKLTEKTRDNPAEYFGNINPLQFKNIIGKFKGVQ